MTAPRMSVPAGTSGISSSLCMMSPTWLSVAPSLPPGWNVLKSIAEKPRASSKATASASPMDSCISAEVVGASPCGQASCDFGRQSTMSDSRASVEFSPDVIAISGMENRREYATMP